MNAKPKNLNAEEQNLIKDILRIIGNDDGLSSEFALCVEMGEHSFNKMCDSIFDKLNNGRLIIKE